MPRTRCILGFTPTVFLLGVVSLANDLASEMIYPLLPVFLTSIGATFTFIGLVEGVAETTASFLKLFSGALADRLGHKRLLTAGGYALSNAVRPLIGLATAAPHVLLLRFSDRVGKGLRTAPRDAIIADHTPPEQRGRAFGFNRSMDHGGAMLGALAAFCLMTFAGVSVRGVFLLSAIPSLLTVVAVVAGLGLARDPLPAGATVPRLSLAPLGPDFRRVLGVFVLFALGNSSDAFLLLRARDLGVSAASLPLLWIVLHAVKSASSTPAGMLSDRAGRTRIVTAGWVVYAAVYAAFCFASEAWHAWALFAAYGLFYGLTEAAEKALLADLVPQSLRGTAFGVYHFAIGAAALPASVLCGYLWQRFSPEVALATGAALAIVSAALLPAINRHTRPALCKHAASK
jgi:MFS family permease